MGIVEYILLLMYSNISNKQYFETTVRFTVG